MRRMLILIFLQNMNFAFSNGSLPESVVAEICISTEEVEKIFFSQNTFMDNNPNHWWLYTGKKLVDYMAYSEKKVLIDVLNSMDAYSLKSYLQSMNYQEYEHFIHRLSEEDWQELLKKISMDDSGGFPKTRQAQIEMLQELYLEAVKKIVRSSDADVFILGGMLASGGNPLVITGGFIASEVNDWEGKGRIEGRLKSLHNNAMPFSEKKALIHQKMMDYYESSMKAGLSGLVDLHKEIDEKVDSLFKERMTKFN